MKKTRVREIEFPRKMESFRMRIDLMEFVRKQAEAEKRSMTNYIESIILSKKEGL